MTTKADIVTILSLSLNVTKKEAKAFLNAFAQHVEGAIALAGEALIPGVGKVKVKERAARTGRNPRTGETLQIGARKTLRLTPTKSLKDSVNS
jgi:DNA-binding protein HU-beta